MSDVISRFEGAIRKVNLLYGLLVPILIGVIMGRLLAFTNPGFFRNDPVASNIYLIVTAIGVLVLLVHFLAKGRVSQIMLVTLYVFYSISLSLLVVFLDPYPTPFYFQFIILLIAIDLLFGKRWQKVGIVCFALIFLTSYLRSGEPINQEGLLLAATYVVGSTSVAVLVSKYRQISDEERKTIATTSRETAFERQRLLSLINNMGEAVVATDEKGKILLYNAAVLNLLDTNQTLDNKRLDSALNLRSKNKRAVKLFDLVKKSTAGLTTRDYLHQFKPGDSINLYINVAPIKLGFREESEHGYIILMRDITREKSLEEERDEFISVVSHELRTPVAIAEGNISNALFVSEKHHDPKVVTDSLNQAHEQVVFLSSMINDLATLSRAERTDIELELTEVDPAQLVHQLGEDYRSQAAEKKLKLTASAAKDTKPLVTSELYLHEILQNFITNAIKYTKEGSVLLHVRSDTKGNAVFSVADTGIGLSKTDQKRVFDKFFRSEDFRTRESSGTGLGLYVTMKLAHRIGAIIHLESELNKGSTFTITVPPLAKKHH